MQAGVAIQVLPQVPETSEVLRIVDAVIAHIDQSGLPYVVGPFETTVEGDLDELLNLVGECQKLAIAEGAPEVASYVKIFYAPQQGVLTTEEKIGKYRDQGVSI